MLATALVIFREILEISIILSIIMAATRGIPRRGPWVMGSIGLGLLGAGLIAAFTESIAAAFEDTGQEVLNAVILLAAAAMIGWTVVWMKTHAREMSQRMRALGAEVVSGETPARMLMTVIALAVFREGSEIVLFSYGLLASGASVSQFVTGAVLGGLGGAAVGAMIYVGLIKVGTKHIFSVTSWLLALVAAGLAARGIGFLVAAQWLPELGASIWNSADILPKASLLGQLLGVLVGYDDNPNGMQVLAYAVVLTAILLAMRLSQRPVKPTLSAA